VVSSHVTILENSNHALDLLGAQAGVVARGVLGASNTSWSRIPLPLDMAGAGALGCSRLVSVDGATAPATS